MSISRLDRAELATFLVGKAVSTAMNHIADSTSKSMEEARSMIYVLLSTNASPAELELIRHTFEWFSRYEDQMSGILRDLKARNARH